MAHTDPRIDAYIQRAAPFAQPLLQHFRALVHKAVPEAEETLKWGMPYFTTHGSILCGMAAFKQHCAFPFRKGVVDDAREGAMGQFGRVAKRSDLPSDKALMGFMKQAAKLNAEKKSAPRKPASASATRAKAKAANTAVKVPPVFARALAKNAAAKKQFQAFPPGKKRDYVEWIAEAKSDDTRERRSTTAVEWIAEGKSRNWKYERR